MAWRCLTRPAAERPRTLTTALVLGVVWALWHVIPYALMGRGAGWIFGTH